MTKTNLNRRILPTLLLSQLLFWWGGALPAQAYPTYNRLGYISCTACHFNPTGGGLLTPYGKSVEASMAGWSRDIDPKEQTWINGAQIRAINTDMKNKANPFLMQADYLTGVKITQSVRADFQLGPYLRWGKPGQFALIQDQGTFWDKVVARRALVTGNVDDSSTFQLGRDLAVAGLNIEDHTSLLRSRDRRGPMDYPTQARYLYQSETYQAMPFLFGPSYEEKNDNQEYGVGFRGEYALNPSNSIGVTALFGNDPAITRTEASAFWRLSPVHWSGLLGEAMFNHRTIHSQSAGFNQENLYIKPYIALPDWIETGFVYEFIHVDSPYQENSYQYGPSVNARLHEYLTFLIDGRKIGTTGQSQWSWYEQLFVHFQI